MANTMMSVSTSTKTRVSAWATPTAPISARTPPTAWERLPAPPRATRPTSAIPRTNKDSDMAELDRSKTFGIIFGDEEGRHFEQDGKFFDAQGKEIGAAKRGRPAKVEEPDELAKQLEG